MFLTTTFLFRCVGGGSSKLIRDGIPEVAEAAGVVLAVLVRVAAAGGGDGDVLLGMRYEVRPLPPSFTRFQ